MLLDKLIQQSGMCVASRGDHAGVTAGNPEISDITADSRVVTPGSLFVAIHGTKEDGRAYVADAVSRGAAAVVSESAPENCPVPWLLVDNARQVPGLLAKALWQIDADAITWVGITGTNGKTTTAHLFRKLFEQRMDPERVWMFGTIEFRLGSRRLPASHTTPESLDIFRFIGRSAIRPGAVIMEVSSHALALDRVSGIVFDLAVLTNVTQDHLDFHMTMENYFEAKTRLFKRYLKPAGSGAVNIDDPWGARLVKELPEVRWVTFGKDPDAAVRIARADCTAAGTTVSLETRNGSEDYVSALRGAFNAYNMTGLYAGSIGLGIDAAAVSAAFGATATVPGRMDAVLVAAPFAVIVDYAHTPDALVNVLDAARAITAGNLICVFGCGGDRDKTKRSLMGAAVAAHADEAIVTSDNPRSENPDTIINEILAGMPLDFPRTVIADRRMAIGRALKTARPGDTIVIAGKGHEQYQEIHGVKHPFNDRETVMELFHEHA